MAREITVQSNGREVELNAFAHDIVTNTVLALVGSLRGVDPESSPLRFLETVDGTQVEVRGEDTVRVTRDESAGEIVVRTRDAFVRIKLPEKKK